MNSIAEIVSGRRLIYVNSAAVVRNGVDQFSDLIDAVHSAYISHANRDVVMPKSEYLRYPNRPNYDRIIPLLGYLGGTFQISGLKQICSSTDNSSRGFSRASGLIIMNDAQTNRPFAILEASLISAARTAAVTGLALREFSSPEMTRLAIVGCGQLGETHMRMVAAEFGCGRFEFILSDLNRASVENLLALAESLGLRAEPALTQKAAIEAADIVITATTAEDAYIDSDWLRPEVLYCAVSLLDAKPNVFQRADHIVVDDLNHCLHEGRPLDLLQKRGELPRNKIFELSELLTSSPRIRLHGGKIVFNPMGTIITDLVVAKFILDRALTNDDCETLEI
jgi:N-[(2S)-2-amino-2-carboxyethyl]-L-glutamate dehydrogenase